MQQKASRALQDDFERKREEMMKAKDETEDVELDQKQKLKYEKPKTIGQTLEYKEKRSADALNIDKDDIKNKLMQRDTPQQSNESIKGLLLLFCLGVCALIQQYSQRKKQQELFDLKMSLA